MGKKRLAGIFGIGLLAASLLGACGATENREAAEQTEVKATEIHVAVQPGTSEFVLNDSLQLLEKEFEGEVTIVYDTFTGGPAIMEAMAAGEVDFAITGDVPVLSAVGNGNDIIAVYRGPKDPDEEQVIALPDSGINSVDDLVGKTVGLSFGSANHSFFVQLLEQNGYSTEDVNLVNISPADLEISLEQGDIDAGVIQENTAATIKNDIGAVMVASTDGVCESLKILSVRRGFAEANEDYTVRFIKVISELDQYSIENPEEVKQLLAESSNNDADDWVCVDRYIYTGEFDDTAKENAQNSIQFLYDNDSLKNVYDAEDAFDGSYYEQALKLLEQ